MANRKWNNASLSAYLTYENKRDLIEETHRSLGLSLKDYFYHLKRKYEASNFSKLN